jgi:hypothetical protein
MICLYVQERVGLNKLLTVVGTYQERFDWRERDDTYKGWEAGDRDLAGRVVSRV